jgi:predicted dehydrogenase
MINVAVVGLGYWGPKLARAFHAIDGATLYAGCDPDEQRRETFRQSFPDASVTPSYAEILCERRIDAVAIATPIGSHSELVRQALLSGKHVLVEKPMTARASDADDLVDLAGQCRRVLMVDHTYLYSPGINAVKSILEQQAVGQIYYVDAQRNNFGEVKPAFNAMWELAPHDMAILVYLLGAAAQVVQAYGGCFLQRGIEDVVHLWLAFPADVHAHVGVTWLAPRKERTMRIVGSHGMVLYHEDQQGEAVSVYDHHVIVGGRAGGGASAIVHHSGQVRQVSLERAEPLRRECEHFVHCVSGVSNPISDGQQGRLVCHMLEAAQRSLAQGGTLQRVMYSDTYLESR